MWINFEGIDGSGKTTVSTRVAEELRRRGVPVVHAREGGRFSSAIAGRIRELGRSVENLSLAAETELFLNLAREAQVTAEVIVPALARGAWVITDRSAASHLGLAEYVRRLPRGAAERAAALASRGLRPDRVFLIDVDPDVARWRRRLRKIRERRLNDGGRKGLAGEGLARRMREAFRDFAAAGGWTVVGNTWRTLDETVREVVSSLGGGAGRSGAEPRFEVDPENLEESYFDFAGSLGDRSLAALLVAGLEDPRAHEIRRLAPPDVAAYALLGMDSPASWEHREELKRESPYYVARSLTGLSSPGRAWPLRRELEPAAPDQVVHSLKGDTGPEAYALRERYWLRHRGECLRSLRAQGDGRAWELRRRAAEEGPDEALAESLSGIDTAEAWRLRRDLRDRHPLAVLQSVGGLDAPEAWSLRRQHAGAAPKAVLGTIGGMDGPEADALRGQLWEAAPEEAAASLRGIDAPSAWRRREEMRFAAPVGVLKSLHGADRARGESLASEILRRCPGRLRVAREAMQFALEASWTESST